jgi:hypothetical protein
VTPEIVARLEGARIQLAAQTKDYWLFVRENCMALVHANESGFTSIGSSGMITENGLAYLLWRDGRPVLSTHGGNESPASAEQASSIGTFSEDLKQALGL